MDVNADFSERVLLHGDTLDWQASPMAGVERRMLDRIGGEVARATSIVRFAEGSAFSEHVHTGGEEFFVLEGVFQDEAGDFPAGSYIRNPPESRHTPRSAPGCTIFVKLWQFDLADRTHMRIDTGKMAALPAEGRPGVSVMPLFRDAREDVRLEVWEAGARVQVDAAGGTEIFVLDGGLEEGGESLRRYSWLRVPGGSIDAVAGPEGARVWIKTGHLRFAAPPAAPAA